VEVTGNENVEIVFAHIFVKSESIYVHQVKTETTLTTLSHIARRRRRLRL